MPSSKKKKSRKLLAARQEKVKLETERRAELAASRSPKPKSFDWFPLVCLAVPVVVILSLGWLFPPFALPIFIGIVAAFVLYGIHRYIERFINKRTEQMINDRHPKL